MQSIAIGRLSAVLVVAFLGGPVLASPAIVSQLELQEKEVLEKLQTDAIWTDPAREKELLDLLKTAGALRCKSLLPVLIPRIAYTPPSVSAQLHRIFPMEDAYPVTAVLNGIGLPAVPAILGRMRKLDPDAVMNPKEAWSNPPREGALLAWCLVEIYNQGGHGRELAQSRLALEVEACEGKDAVLLKKFLEHYLITGKYLEQPAIYEPPPLKK